MHIYIHIPFCKTKCPYCAFGSSSDEFDLVKLYFSSLKEEINSYLTKNPNIKISTIFIGGGTPSSVSYSFYEDIFALLNPFLLSNAEITSEANPNSVSFEWLLNMKAYGINRISFGGQSFNEKKLKFLGRTHSVNDIFKAVENAKKANFDNINVDFIYSTKFDTQNIIESEMQNIKSLNTSHISAYSLTLEENTPFHNKINYQKDSPKISQLIFDRLQSFGFKQYEISNFGRICEHNLGYWKQEDYLGFGAYAVGFVKNTRFYSPKSIKEYIKNPPKKDLELLNKNDLKTEHILLGARSIIGISSAILNKKELENAIFLEKNGKLLFKNNRFFNNNLLLSDEIALFITSEF